MKSFFNWDHNFVTGLPDVDDQHKQLVGILNQFSALLAADEVHVTDIDHVFEQLTEYAVYHFHEEEKLMANVHIDPRYLADHVRKHKQFVDDVSALHSRISPQNIDQSQPLQRYLIHWLAHHILGKDQEMAKQIKAIESGSSARDAYDQLEQEKIGATSPLLNALDGLLEQVSMQNRELKKLNEELEEKVALRTEELAKANLHLEELSFTDMLTRLPNRRRAIRTLSRLWEEGHTPLTCIMIDADNFKQVNDSYGHDAGDRVLKTLAKTLRESFRNDDMVCRLGGDEFFVICPDTHIEGGMHIAESIREAVAELRVPTGGEPWRGSVSVGVATRSPDMQGFDDIMKKSDAGVYMAKHAGRNCVRTEG